MAAVRASKSKLLAAVFADRTTLQLLPTARFTVVAARTWLSSPGAGPRVGKQRLSSTRRLRRVCGRFGDPGHVPAPREPLWSGDKQRGS